MMEAWAVVLSILYFCYPATLRFWSVAPINSSLPATCDAVPLSLSSRVVLSRRVRARCCATNAELRHIKAKEDSIDDAVEGLKNLGRRQCRSAILAGFRILLKSLEDEADVVSTPRCK